MKTTPCLTAVALLAACGIAPTEVDVTSQSSDPIAVPAPGSASASPGPTSSGLGTVVPSQASCAPGQSNVPNTTCRVVTVQCPGLADLDVELRITEAPVGAPARGTVVFGAGGGGNFWYEGASPDSPPSTMLATLSRKGFRVVQRRWVSDWEAGDRGLVASSCRYATLLTFVDEKLRTGGALCASGNSGGNTEISYALGYWGMGARLDMAAPSGGPPMGRVDFGCIRVAQDPQWCAPLIPAGWEVTPSCGYTLSSELLHIDEAYGTVHPCESRDVSYAGRLHDDSNLSADAVLSYPKTKVDFLWGMRDNSYAVAGGLLFANAVTSEKTLTFVPGTPHPVFSTPQGAQAIEDAIDRDCVARH